MWWHWSCCCFRDLKINVIWTWILIVGIEHVTCLTSARRHTKKMIFLSFLPHRVINIPAAEGTNHSTHKTVHSERLPNFAPCRLDVLWRKSLIILQSPQWKALSKDLQHSSEQHGTPQALNLLLSQIHIVMENSVHSPCLHHQCLICPLKSFQTFIVWFRFVWSASWSQPLHLLWYLRYEAVPGYIPAAHY